MTDVPETNYASDVSVESQIIQPTASSAAVPVPGLCLSELMVKNHAVLQASDGSFPDWIEIYNADTVPIDLAGWCISDNKSGGYVLPKLIMQPGEYCVVFADGSGRIEDGAVYVDFSLSPHETVYLFTPQGTIADWIESGSETANHSIARDEEGNLFETKDATPGLPNTGDGIEAFCKSLTPAGPLSINEVVVANFSTVPLKDKYYDWVEIKNISDTTVQLADYYLSDDENELQLFRFPESELGPGQMLLVFCSGDETLSSSSSLHANFRLDRNEEDLFLSNSERVIDYVYLRDVPPDGSMGRHPDELGWYSFLVATPCAENGDIIPYIDKTYLIAGEPLRIKNSFGFKLEYCVSGKETADGELMLDEVWYEQWITVKAFRDDLLISEDSVYFSRLPVLYINTSDGKPVKKKNVYRSGSMLIQNNVDTEYYEYADTIQIRGQGHSSWNLWPKKPYRIKLGSKTDLFGMGESKNWVLLANYLDESLLRNTTGTQVSAQLGLVSMESVWVDVILNGEYVGNYQLCEQVRIENSRVDIFDWEEEAERVAAAVWEKEQEKGRILNLDLLEKTLKEDLKWITSGSFTFRGEKYLLSDYTYIQDDISGGYLFELSDEFKDPSKFLTDSSVKVALKSPTQLRTNRDMMNYVKEYWCALDKALRSEDGYAETADGPKHYTEMADLDSMVAFWLTYEILGNNDAATKSRFAYKDLNGLIKFGPVWDFDWGCGSIKTPSDGEGWILATNGRKQSFYREFLDDPLFVVRATELYWEVRPYLEELVRDGGILELETSYLLESGLADQTRWDRKKSWPADARGFEQDSEMFRQFLRQRINWLDKEFETDTALLESVSTELSACPYTRDDKILITLPGAMNDTVSAHAAAEAAVYRGEDVSITVAVYTAEAEYLDIYVNGLFDQSVPVNNSSAQFVVPAARLAAEGKSVVSLIARNASGENVGRNFTTVLPVD